MKNRYAILDGCRGIAILAVIWHHFFAYLTPAGWAGFQFMGVDILPATIFANGWLGVSFFFAISGFVLQLPYEQGRRQFNTGRDLLWYYKNRALRLLPLYYAAVIVGFVYIAPPPAKFFWNDLTLMTTVTFVFTDYLWSPPYNFVLWSLGVEIWFSLIFPGLVWLAKKFGIEKVFWCSVILSFLVRLYGTDAGFDIPGNPYGNPIRNSLLGRLDEFLLGMLICSMWIKNRAELKRKYSDWPLLVGGIVFLFVASELWDEYVLGGLMRFMPALIDDAVLVAIFGILSYLLNNENNWLTKVIAAKPLRWIGLISYSLYIWHGDIMLKFFGIKTPRSLNESAVFLACVFAVGTISYFVIERNPIFRPKPYGK